jgi:hypothetical protein
MYSWHYVRKGGAKWDLLARKSAITYSYSKFNWKALPNHYLISKYFKIKGHADIKLFTEEYTLTLDLLPKS